MKRTLFTTALHYIIWLKQRGKGRWCWWTNLIITHITLHPTPTLKNTQAVKEYLREVTTSSNKWMMLVWNHSLTTRCPEPWRTKRLWSSSIRFIIISSLENTGLTLLRRVRPLKTDNISLILLLLTRLRTRICRHAKRNQGKEDSIVSHMKEIDDPKQLRTTSHTPKETDVWWLQAKMKTTFLTYIYFPLPLSVP